MATPRGVSFAVFTSAILLATSAAAAPTFKGLGTLRDQIQYDPTVYGTPFSYARAISADGLTVVGGSTVLDGTRPYRWTAETGMVPLEGVPDRHSAAASVSANGKVVVGNINGVGAFRWSESGGFGQLPEPSYFIQRSGVLAISGDGLTVGGVTVPGDQLPSIWTPDAGWQLQGPDAAPGSTYALSADGKVAAGTYYKPGDGVQAFRWTQEAGFEDLGDLPGGRAVAEARSISADGNTIVGFSEVANGWINQAFRWTTETGMVGLESPLGGSKALAVSADGAIVGGYAIWPNIQEAALWDSSDHLHSVRELLIAMGGGSQVENWHLGDVIGISADHRTIAGNGGRRDGYAEAWIATTSPADLNADWTVDAFDVNIVSQHWGELGPAGDANGDGVVDIFDVNAISDGWSIMPDETATLGVPEPSSIALFVIATIALVLESTRRFSPSLLRHRQAFADGRVAVE